MKDNNKELPKSQLLEDLKMLHNLEKLVEYAEKKTYKLDTDQWQFYDHNEVIPFKFLDDE